MKPSVSIGERLRKVREDMKLNQSDFAAIIGASRQTQSNYEKGERMPDALYLAAIAAAGADVNYILTGNKAETQQRLDKLKQATELADALPVSDELKLEYQELFYTLLNDPELKALVGHWPECNESDQQTLAGLARRFVDAHPIANHVTGIQINGGTEGQEKTGLVQGVVNGGLVQSAVIKKNK